MTRTYAIGLSRDDGVLLIGARVACTSGYAPVGL